MGMLSQLQTLATVPLTSQVLASGYEHVKPGELRSIIGLSNRIAEVNKDQTNEELRQVELLKTVSDYLKKRQLSEQQINDTIAKRSNLLSSENARSESFLQQQLAKIREIASGMTGSVKSALMELGSQVGKFSTKELDTALKAAQQIESSITSLSEPLSITVDRSAADVAKSIGMLRKNIIRDLTAIQKESIVKEERIAPTVTKGAIEIGRGPFTEIVENLKAVGYQPSKIQELMQAIFPPEMLTVVGQGKRIAKKVSSTLEQLQESTRKLTELRKEVEEKSTLSEEEYAAILGTEVSSLTKEQRAAIIANLPKEQRAAVTAFDRRKRLLASIDEGILSIQEAISKSVTAQEIRFTPPTKSMEQTEEIYLAPVFNTLDMAVRGIKAIDEEIASLPSKLGGEQAAKKSKLLEVRNALEQRVRQIYAEVFNVDKTWEEIAQDVEAMIPKLKAKQLAPEQIAKAVSETLGEGFKGDTIGEEIRKSLQRLIGGKGKETVSKIIENIIGLMSKGFSPEQIRDLIQKSNL